MAPNSVRSVDVAVGKTASAQTRNATTIAELISTIPQTWRPVLGDYLNKIYRVATKLCNVQNTIAQYDKHVAEGSFPASIRNSIKDPKIQFSKEFLGTSDGALTKSLGDAEIHTARKSLLAFAVKRKKEELAALQECVAWNAATWRSKVLEIALRTAGALGASVQGNAAGDAAPVWTGDISSAVVEDCTTLWSLGNVWHYRAIAVARSLADRSLVEKTKSLRLKTETDTVMKDADTELSTREVVRDEMQAQMRLLKSEIAKLQGTSLGKRRDSPLTFIRHRKKVPSEWKTERAEHLSSQERVTPEEGSEQETQSMTTASFLSECSKDFRPWLPETYPLVYNSLSLDTRMKIGFALMRTWEVDTVRAASPGVFKHADVSLPEDIEYMLAVNHKFILHQNPLDHDIEEAKTSLQRSIRNRWFFRDKFNSDFIPKFHVANPNWNPPLASVPIEQGLDAAMEVIDSQVSRALATMATRPAAHPFIGWTRAQEFLADNRLLAKLTDKNLGLAVFPIEWYDANVLVMLSDHKTYRHVTEIPTLELKDKLFDQLSSWRLPPAMDRFIRRRTHTDVPEFHAIPKVHKTPWTLRPIVPSHSWVTSTTSSILDHLCQPLLEHMPWIVASSKDVINQLEKVRAPTEQPVWILTGDMTAMYSNIPPHDCAKIITGMWKEHRKESSIPAASIGKMSRFIMDNNYLSYQQQAFHQINGLAMGTACAPVLANIYAGYFERKARVISKKGVLLYVRYIDDILSLFQGTREEVKEFCESLSIGPLQITWSIQPSRNEFLDIELLREPGIAPRVVHTRLFRKKLNRHLYIPWSSAHPLHVKKGFVKAELTRFAMICSKEEFFAEARQELYGNLRRRGYPAETLKVWFQQVQYGSRPVFLLVKEKQDRAPLMLPGHYNPVWDFVEVKEIISEARKFWIQEELPESLQEPLIRSLGRTTSLFDLLSVWNKTTLLSSSLSGPAMPPLGEGPRREVVPRRGAGS